MARAINRSFRFQNADGISTKFYMRPCSNRKKIHELIEEHGGIFSNIRYGGDIIRLVEKGDIIISKDSVYSTYITDCVAANKLLDINNYRCDAENKDDSDGNLSFESDQTNVIKIQAKDFKGRRKFLKSDDQKIMQYIINEKYEDLVNGNSIWKEMEARKITLHSWQSMKCRYRDFLNKQMHTNIAKALFPGKENEASCSKVSSLQINSKKKDPKKSSENHRNDSETCSSSDEGPLSPGSFIEDNIVSKTTKVSGDVVYPRKRARSNNSPNLTHQQISLTAIRNVDIDKKKISDKGPLSPGSYIEDNIASKTTKSPAKADCLSNGNECVTVTVEQNENSFFLFSPENLSDLVSPRKRTCSNNYPKLKYQQISQTAIRNADIDKKKISDKDDVSPRKKIRSTDDLNLSPQKMTKRAIRNINVIKKQITDKNDSPARKKNCSNDSPNLSPRQMVQTAVRNINVDNNQITDKNASTSNAIPELKEFEEDEEFMKMVKLVEDLMNDFGLTYKQVLNILYINNGVYEDALHWIYHKTSKNGKPPWSAIDDVTIQSQNPKLMEHLLRIHGQDGIHKRYEYLNSKF